MARARDGERLLALLLPAPGDDGGNGDDDDDDDGDDDEKRRGNLSPRAIAAGELQARFTRAVAEIEFLGVGRR